MSQNILIVALILLSIMATTPILLVKVLWAARPLTPQDVITPSAFRFPNSVTEVSMVKPSLMPGLPSHIYFLTGLVKDIGKRSLTFPVWVRGLK